RDLAGALPWYQQVIDSGDSEAPLAAAHLGELHYWLGDRDGALRYYELTITGTENAELVAEACHRLGEIRYERGEVRTAAQMWRRAYATGDETFAPQSAARLAELSPQ
ncbi:MAG: tetratricopeptide repeat protein, partial [Micromonosporaceae bacterium]|nr:tetratricopeptide repeat protein [Micromonosporaceae bacterium]